MSEPPAPALQLALDGAAIPYPETIPKPIRPARRRAIAATADCDGTKAELVVSVGQLDGLDAIEDVTGPDPRSLSDLKSRREKRS